MNILFLSIGRVNDISDNGLYTDLLRTFKNNGHNIYIITPREKRLNQPTEHFTKDGVEFLKVRIGNITKSNLIEKGISTIMIERKFLKAYKKEYGNIKFDLILYSTPPITFDKIIKYVKDKDNAKSYLLLKDIFPQNAVDLNMFSKRGFLYHFFRRKEKKLYINSDYIGCMSEANRNYILKNNKVLNSETVEVCPNTIEPIDIIVTENEKKKIRRKYKIPIDKTVYIYGGNLGKPQGLDFLIKCIEANEIHRHTYILIVGSGTEFNKMNDFFVSKKPKNAKLLKQLPKDDYEILVNSCDVGLIFLDRRFTIPNFPSRLLSYMQASMPILAATDTNTDIGKVIEDGKFGFWCESGNLEKYMSLLNELNNDELRRKLGTNARNYLENNYTAKHSYEVIMSHFKS